jgi:RNA polymerase sigma-70 factor (ECF subfamily)
VDATTEVDEAWRAHRHYVLDLAFRMLGNLAEAEDVVQEAYIRLLDADLDEIDDLRGWLVVVVSRRCLDVLRSARVRHASEDAPREDEPSITFTARAVDPADRVTLDDNIRLALFFVVERLTPAERAVFVLHDVFGFAFDAVGSIVGRTPAACRKLASRARQRIADDADPARFSIDPVEQRLVADRFIAACAGGDLAALMEVLDPDVVGEVDLGDSPLSRRRFTGSDRVGSNLLRLFGPATGSTMVSFPADGRPGVLVFDGQDLAGLLVFELHDGVIDHIRAIADPDKLAALAPLAGH